MGDITYTNHKDIEERLWYAIMTIEEGGVSQYFI